MMQENLTGGQITDNPRPDNPGRIRGSQRVHRNFTNTKLPSGAFRPGLRSILGPLGAVYDAYTMYRFIEGGMRVPCEVDPQCAE
jgi:hypothetical protein